MMEFQSLKNLIYKLQFDESFRQRNISAIVQSIPYIGALLDANIFQEKKDEELKLQLNKLDEISRNALNYEDANDIISLIENNSLTINKFIKDYRSLLSDKIKDIVEEIEPINIALSFVDEDIEIANKFIKDLSDYEIKFVTNNRKVKNDKCLYYNKLPFKIDALVIIYTENYEKYNSSSYNSKTFLNSALSRRIPSIIYAIQHDTSESKISFQFFNKRYFNTDFKKINFQDYFLVDYELIKKKEKDELNSNLNVENILKQYNAEFQKIDVFKKDNIGYELYLLEHLTGKKSYCIYLYNPINSKKTIDYILRKHHKNIIENLFVLINRPQIKNPEERIKYLTKIFEKKINIFFIDDFVWEKLTSKFFNQEKKEQIPIENFVEPYMNYKNNKIDGFNFIDNWLNSEKNPILIITGSGGIGKTTLASKIANRINNKNSKTNAIFIDAIKISSTLKQISLNEDNINLYSLYLANIDNSLEKLNYELFKINIDFGNIVIIIDGLDEIISRLGEKFNIDEFFESIHNFTSNMGNGKIILTSRNYFWNNTVQDIEGFEIIDILPFDLDKTKLFFKNYFPYSNKSVEKALKITNSIISKDYLPYILELVRFMIEDTDEDGLFFDPDFDSEILNQNIKNDFVLGKFCIRETQRVNQVPVDLQLLMFFEIANNKISEENFTSIISKLLEDKINNKQIEVFKSHPFLEIFTNNEISFKYDFFNNHIKNIYLGLLFKGKMELHINHISILNNLISYNSSFTDDICDRIDSINDDNIYLYLSIIDSIKNFSSLFIKEELKRKAVSSVFIIMLKKNHKDNLNNVESNTIVLKKLFETSKNFLEYINIYDLSSSNSNKIIFDFKDLIINNSSFSSYDYFWECNFNLKTNFNNCSFNNLSKEDDLNTSAKKINFKNNSYEDTLFTEIINSVREVNQNKKQNIMQDIHNFISIFINNSGSLQNKVYAKVAQLYKPKEVPIDKMIKVTLKNDLIESYHHNGVKYLRICQSYQAQILKYYSNRITSDIIKKIYINLDNK